jgi:hypothetical protein
VHLLAGKDCVMAYNFPIARRLFRWSRSAARQWRLRHQHPVNFTLHLIGIPLALAGLILLAFVSWPYALAGFCGGYLLQWIGHRIEGNDVGELIPFKRWLGLPVVAIAPQYLPAVQEPQPPNQQTPIPPPNQQMKNS